MKKIFTLYLIGIIISIVAIIVAIILAVILEISLLLVFAGVLLYLPICVILVGLLFKSLEKSPSKEIIIKELPSNAPDEVSSLEEKETHDMVNDSIHEKWAIAMYERFGEKWSKLFSDATYPADKSTRGEICVELWEIASLTMDYLYVVNSDPNVLRRNKEMTNAVINRLNLIEDVELKEYYNDPTSVQQKVLIISDLLSSQLAAKQMFKVPVFGYKVALNVKK